MKKKFKITGLDCGHCASRLEEALNKIEGIDSAKVNFLTQKVTIEAEEENMERVCEEVKVVTKKTLPDCKLS